MKYSEDVVPIVGFLSFLVIIFTILISAVCVVWGLVGTFELRVIATVLIVSSFVFLSCLYLDS